MPDLISIHKSKTKVPFFKKNNGKHSKSSLPAFQDARYLLLWAHTWDVMPLTASSLSCSGSYLQIRSTRVQNMDLWIWFLDANSVSRNRSGLHGTHPRSCSPLRLSHAPLPHLSLAHTLLIFCFVFERGPLSVPQADLEVTL